MLLSQTNGQLNMVRKLVVSVLIRSRLDSYESRLAIGWTHQMFIDELKEDGFVVSLRYFSRCIVKARRMSVFVGKPPVVLEPVKLSNSDIHQAPVKLNPFKKSKEPFKISTLLDEDLF